MADSVVLSTGGRVAECFPEVPGSPANSDVQNTIRTPADSAENPHFRGFSQNSKSCGVPARLKTSELSAHQMPKILHAERSSNASSASGLGVSTLDPWEQASRKSYRSLLDGGAIAIWPRRDVCQTGAEGEASRETDQEENFSYVPVGVWPKLRRRGCRLRK